jgi:hypothetical protein
MEKSMKIALCISGQPRIWEKCYQNWLDNIFPKLEKDIFFHFWTYNTLPASAPREVKSKENTKDIPLDQDELNRIVDTLKPKKYCYDDRNINVTNAFDSSLVNKYVTTPLGWWCRSQYYSQWYASRLKRQHEIENNFEYDIVFRIRTDLFFRKPVILPTPILPNSIYSPNNSWMTSTESFMIGDTFYFSDSFTFDQISEFYWALYYIDTYDVVPRHIPCPPPEAALYPFVRSMGIINTVSHQDFKIMRSQDYADLVGELKPYEII